MHVISMETLSDKIRYGELSSFALGRFDWCKTEDVKEFIRELKEEFEVDGNPCDTVDKLAGDKLI